LVGVTGWLELAYQATAKDGGGAPAGQFGGALGWGGDALSGGQAEVDIGAHFGGEAFPIEAWGEIGSHGAQGGAGFEVFAVAGLAMGTAAQMACHAEAGPEAEIAAGV
jgi:hypothetical protein